MMLGFVLFSYFSSHLLECSVKKSIKNMDVTFRKCVFSRFPKTQKNDLGNYGMKLTAYASIVYLLCH